MVLLNSYYLTPRLEIKPQPEAAAQPAVLNYLTPRLEIKPQLRKSYN